MITLTDDHLMNLTITRCASYVSGVASFAKTPEGAHGVNALPIPAKVCQDLTFINICTEIIKYMSLYILNMLHLSFDFNFFLLFHFCRVPHHHASDRNFLPL